MEKDIALLHQFCEELKSVHSSSIETYRDYAGKCSNLGMYEQARVWEGMIESCYRTIGTITRLEAKFVNEYKRGSIPGSVLLRAFIKSKEENLI